MSHSTKLWKNVFERRLRRHTQNIENQFGFILESSTMEEIYLLRHAMKRYQMDQQEFNLVFINLEKMYDRMSREILWKL